MTEKRSITIMLLVLLLAACSSPGAPGSAPPYVPPPNPPRPTDCAPAAPADPARTSGWLGQVKDRPDDVGLVIDTGRGPVVSHGADRQMPLASAVKVVHLAAYGRAVAEGRIRPDEPVAVAEWERWWFPTDGGAHPAAIARLRPGATVTVDEMVSAMIQESDNAATDWLRDRLGDEALLRAAADGGWAPFDLPSELGAALALVLPEQAPPLAAPRAERAGAEVALAGRYANDPGFRDEAVRRLMVAVADPERFLAANAAWAERTATGSAAQLVGMYRALATGGFGAGSDVAARHLDWLPAQPRGQIGFKGGLFATVLTVGLWLRRPDGTTGVAAVLARGLLGVDARMTNAQQAFALRSLDEPARLAALTCVARDR